MTEIEQALRDVHAATSALANAKDRLWAALLRDEPQLLELVSAMGLRPDQARPWLVEATLADGRSALELIATGHTDQVRAAAMRMLHGVVG